MSESIPESIPTSSYKRPAKRVKITDSASQQSSQIEALFANPDRNLEVVLEKKAQAPAPPEIVQNIQGSSSGAGSGEFHVYKASRRREYERLRAMDEEVETEKADQEWQARREEMQRKDEAKLNKNRARREKAKQRQAKKQATPDAEGAIPELKKKMAPAKVTHASANPNDELTDTMTIEEDGLTFLEDN